MNQQDLENLPFPMFKTTWYEKRILRKALKRDNIFLCVRLNSMWFNRGLKGKITKSLGYKELDTLDNYMMRNADINGHPYFWTDSERVEMRNVWIKKLLDYKGEQTGI